MKEKWKQCKEIVLPIVISVVIVGVFLCFFRPAVVDGMSMYPTLTDGDILLLRRNTNNLQRGDIIAISAPTINKVLCKRVIGLPTDHVVINQEGLFVNDVLLEENYLYENNWTKKDINIFVSEGNVFVLGDNRNNSSDSRVLGCISTTQILGIFTSDITSIFHITSYEYKTVLYILWLIFLTYYIVTYIIRFFLKHKE